MSLRRPAAAGAALRRPAAAVEAPPERGRRRLDFGAAYNRGEVVKASELAPALLDKGHWLVSEESKYFEEDCKWAGKVVRVTLEAGEAEVQVEVTGTQSEALLKFASSKSPPIIRAHLCKEDCDQKRSNPDLVHLKSFKKVAEGVEKTWETNLVLADENAPLRRAQEAWSRRERGEGEDQEGSSISGSSGKKKRRKKKDKKKKSSRKEKKAKKIGGKTAAKKPLSVIFENTGLDPDPGARKKLLKKVRRRLRKSKTSTSSTSSSSTSASPGPSDQDILEDRSRIQKIASMGPGILSATAIQSMKQFVLQAGGSTWSMDEDSLPPLMSQYARMHLAPRASGGLLREILTHAHVGDLILQGRVSEALDTVAQRLKSLELVLSGQPWSTAQKVEVAPNLEATISSRAEVQVAMKESRLDSQAKGSMSPWEKGRGKSKGKEKDKGKPDKGKSKGKDDAKKNS
jgi:hypothetical protein